jgi:hypothetical protein
MTSVADELLKLRFAPRSLQSLYLNVDRVNERFIGHSGAITDWTRTAGKEGGGGFDLKVVKGDAKATFENQITYGIDNPIVRSLLLRDSLQAAGVIHDAKDAGVGEYVISSGRACLRNPHLESQFPPNLVQHEAWCPTGSDPTYQKLELDRARAEAIRLALAGPASSNDRMWLLALMFNGSIKAASVLNSLWINDSIISYWHSMWKMFGTVREIVDGVPLIAAIHVWADLPEE